MLFEIEGYIEKYMRFFTICQKIDQPGIETLAKVIRQKNKELKQFENNKKKAEEEELKNKARLEKQKIPRITKIILSII